MGPESGCLFVSLDAKYMLCVVNFATNVCLCTGYEK